MCWELLSDTELSKSVEKDWILKYWICYHSKTAIIYSALDQKNRSVEAIQRFVREYNSLEGSHCDLVEAQIPLLMSICKKWDEEELWNQLRRLYKSFSRPWVYDISEQVDNIPRAPLIINGLLKPEPPEEPSITETEEQSPESPSITVENSSSNKPTQTQAIMVSEHSQPQLQPNSLSPAHIKNLIDKSSEEDLSYQRPILPSFSYIIKNHNKEKKREREFSPQEEIITPPRSKLCKIDFLVNPTQFSN